MTTPPDTGPDTRIVFTLAGLDEGGTEKQLLLLAQALTRRSVECLVAPLDGSGPVAQQLRDSGIEIQDLGFRRRGSAILQLLLLAQAAVRLWLLLRRVKPHVLQAYLPLPNLVGSVIARLAGVPQIITNRRGMGLHQKRHPFWAPFDRLANSASHRIVTNSKAVLTDTLERDRPKASKLSVIYNAIPGLDISATEDTRAATRRELAIGDDDIAVACVGNLFAYKGHMDMVNAMAQIKDRGKRYRLFLVGGDRGEKQPLLDYIAAHELGQTVTLLGARSDVPSVLAGMDVFVLPSHEEGFSNALLEAMLVGLPTIATNVGGNPEALEDGGLGILVPPRSPNALAQALLQLTEDLPDATREARRQVQHIQSKYAVNQMVDAYLDLYGKSQAAGS